MKKLLGILVLGLLLSTNAISKDLESVFKKGISKKEMCKLTRNKKALKGTVLPGAAYCHKAFQSSYIYLSEYKTEIIPPMKYYNVNTPHPEVYFVFESVTEPMKCKFNTICDHGNGRLKSIAYSYDEALSIADPVYAKKIEDEKKRKEEEKKKEPKTTEPSPDDTKVVAAASGSGFFVSNTGHIVTNHHVIDECKAVKVNFKGDEIEAKILAIDKTNDLAILKAKINPSKVFTISNEDVTLLQDIIVAGFPLGKRVSAAIKTHKGSVTALAGYKDNYSNFQTDATINQGNSGGPIMNQKGNVVGVAVALLPVEKAQNVFFGVKSSTLKTFGKSNNINFLPPNYRDMSNADLGKLITEATVYLECWMTIAKIKQMIAQTENRKAFYSEFNQ